MRHIASKEVENSESGYAACRAVIDWFRQPTMLVYVVLLSRADYLVLIIFAQFKSFTQQHCLRCAIPCSILTQKNVLSAQEVHLPHLQTCYSLQVRQRSFLTAWTQRCCAVTGFRWWPVMICDWLIDCQNHLSADISTNKWIHVCIRWEFESREHEI